MMRVLVLLSFFFAICPVHSQNELRRFTVMSYNCENLFDTIHQTGQYDVEFTPFGEKKWNSRRYWKKLGKLRTVIAAIGGDKPVDVVGLCEIENDSVLFDLTRRTALKQFAYEYVVTKGHDKRGINVALLYRPLSFAPFAVTTRSFTVPKGETPTRDLLMVSGETVNGDTLDFFVCHLPSRSSGTVQREQYRYNVARTIRGFVDSLMNCRTTARIILMGDFNDDISDASLEKALRVNLYNCMPLPHWLYDLTPRRSGNIEGTYKFQRQWNHLDHIIVSGALLQSGSSFFTRSSDCEIIAFPFLLEADGKNSVRPKRTYSGPFYRGGYSDHLPLRIDFWH